MSSIPNVSYPEGWDYHYGLRFPVIINYCNKEMQFHDYGTYHAFINKLFKDYKPLPIEN